MRKQHSSDESERSDALPCGVWWAPIVQSPDGLIAILDGPDRARYERFRFTADRSRFLSGRLLARQALGTVLGVDPLSVRLAVRCPTCGGPHGKPLLAGSPLPVDFSIAHAAERVVVATALGAQVGADVERIGPSRSLEGLDEAEAGVLTRQERAALDALPAADRHRAFFRLWTRKEAVLKATGQGLGVPMALLEVAGPAHPPEVVAWPDGERARPVRMRDLDVGDGYAACVAVLTSRPLSVTEHPLGALAPR